MINLNNHWFYWEEYQTETKDFDIHTKLMIKSSSMPDKQRAKHDKHETKKFHSIEKHRAAKRSDYTESPFWDESKTESKIRKQG